MPKAANFSAIDDRLYKKPYKKSLQHWLQDFHDHGSSVEQTFKISSLHLWVRLLWNYQKVCWSSYKCQAYRKKKKNTATPLRGFKISAIDVFRKLMIDLIYLLMTKQENIAAIMMIDYLTFWVDTKPNATLGAATPSSAIFKRACHHSKPQIIICDNSAYFMAQQVKEYL